MTALLILLVVFVSVVELYLIFYGFEYLWCVMVRSQIPFVHSVKILRNAVVNEINMHYPNAKNVCDIGAGYGGLGRQIARQCGCRVVGMENMPFTFLIAKMFDLFSSKNSRVIKCDAFEYLENTDEHFDVAVVYLGPGVVDRVVKYSDKISVLISLDFELKTVKPCRVIDLQHGYTLYNNTKFPHKLFVYEF